VELKRERPAPPAADSDREHFLRGQRGIRATRSGRRFSRGRLRRLVALLALVVAGVGGVWISLAVSNASSLVISRVFVEGNERLSDGEILELLQLNSGSNILTADLLVLRERLLRSAWVESVELKRILPATLTLQIQERKPVAVAVLDELYLLAADGTVLDQLSTHYGVESLVLARGVAGPSGIDPVRAALAGRIAERLEMDERLALEVSEVDVSDGAQSVRLYLRTFPFIVLGSEESLVSRFAEVVPLLGGLLERYRDLDVVDLRFRGRVYLRTRPPTPEGLSTSTAFASGGAPF
jgi:cell division protein FtsQ